MSSAPASGLAPAPASASAVVEHLELAIAPEKSEAFVAMMDRAGRRALAEAPGCTSVAVMRGVEREAAFLLLIMWDSIEAHMAFRETDAFRSFIDALKPHLAGRPAMEHFRQV